MSVDTKLSVYDELIDYLVTLATPEQILAFQLSEETQEYVATLMEKNNEGELTTSERKQLNEFVEFDLHVMILKARATAALKVVS